MEDYLKIWTTVGSAGSVTAKDLAQVRLEDGVIALGHDLAPPAAGPTADPSAAFPPVTAVVRYNVTPVDGLFFPPPPAEYHYQLQVCYRGVVRARLVQVALADGAENDLLHFDSTAYPPAHTFVANVATTTESSTPMDFVNFAYYVEATLSASAIVVGNPAEIAVIKVYPSPEFHG